MQALQTDRTQAPENDFERPNGVSSERVYVLDLDTREITVPSQEQVLGSVDNHISHTALTDAGLNYRTRPTRRRAATARSATRLR